MLIEIIFVALNIKGYFYDESNIKLQANCSMVIIVKLLIKNYRNWIFIYSRVFVTAYWSLKKIDHIVNYYVKVDEILKTFSNEILNFSDYIAYKFLK